MFRSSSNFTSCSSLVPYKLSSYLQVQCVSILSRDSANVILEADGTINCCRWSTRDFLGVAVCCCSRRDGRRITAVTTSRVRHLLRPNKLALFFSFSFCYRNTNCFIFPLFADRTHAVLSLVDQKDDSTNVNRMEWLEKYWTTRVCPN